MYITTFLLTGHFGSFPLDMLRRDACYPDTEGDVAVMHDSLSAHPFPALREPGEAKRYQLRLVTRHQSRQPNLTPDRWASFGWSLDRQSISTRKA